MNLIKKGNRERHANGACTVYEYPHGDPRVGVACAEIRGRYPGSGFALNEKSEELFIVTRGKGRITAGGRSYELSEGDSAMILPGERYFFEGDLDMLLCNSPAWNPSQYREVE